MTLTLASAFGTLTLEVEDERVRRLADTFGEGGDRFCFLCAILHVFSYSALISPTAESIWRDGLMVEEM